MLVSKGQAAATSMSVFFYGSFALNILMAASFQLLWGMLNVIQLIINMPLLNVNFPSNAVFFYNLIMTLA